MDCLDIEKLSESYIYSLKNIYKIRSIRRVIEQEIAELKLIKVRFKLKVDDKEKLEKLKHFRRICNLRVKELLVDKGECVIKVDYADDYKGLKRLESAFMYAAKKELNKQEYDKILNIAKSILTKD